MWWQILSALGGLAVTVAIAIATFIYVKYTKKLWTETKETARLTSKNIKQTQRSLELSTHTALFNLSLFFKQTYENAARQSNTLSQKQQKQALAWHTLALAYFDIALEFLFPYVDLSKNPELIESLTNLLETSEQLGVDLASNKVVQRLKGAIEKAKK